MKSRDLAPFHHIARILSVESHDSIVFPIIVRPMPTMVIPHFGVNIGHGPSGGGRCSVSKVIYIHGISTGQWWNLLTLIGMKHTKIVKLHVAQRTQ